MRARGLGWIALLAAAACSDITATDEGVASLVLFIPSPAEIEVGQTRQLRARAVNAGGDTLDVPVIWRALDTTITVDSLQGLLTGVIAGVGGYVIARVGTFFSDSVRFSVLPRVDTLVVVGPDTLDVVIAEDSSAALTVRLDGGTPPTPISGRRILYEVVEPVFASFEDRSVDLTGDLLLRSASSGNDESGSTVPPVRLRRRQGFGSPALAVVEVSAYRPGGDAVPGSGQRFVVRFENP